MNGVESGAGIELQLQLQLEVLQDIQPPVCCLSWLCLLLLAW